MSGAATAGAGLLREADTIAPHIQEATPTVVHGREAAPGVAHGREAGVASRGVTGLRERRTAPGGVVA